MDREEAGERQPRQDCGEQRQEKVIGQLRGQAETVVGAGFLCRPRQQLAPTDRAVNVRKHAVTSGKSPAGDLASTAPSAGTTAGLAYNGNVWVPRPPTFLPPCPGSCWR